MFFIFVLSMGTLPLFRCFALVIKSIDGVKKLHFVCVELKVEKLIKLFVFILLFLFDELNRKSHHIKEPQILCIPPPNMEFDAVHSDCARRKANPSRTVRFSLVDSINFLGVSTSHSQTHKHTQRAHIT